MANKFARSNGDFNDASIWSLSATGLSATTVPTIGDNAYSNSFTVRITGDVACDLISNGSGTLGGRFDVFSSTNSINISANVSTHTGFGAFVNNTTDACLSVTNPQFTNIFGNITVNGANRANHAVLIDTLSSVNIFGTLLNNISFPGGDQGGAAVYISRVNTLNIYGNVIGGQNNSGNNTNNVGLRNVSSSNAIVNIYGNISATSNNEGLLNQGSNGVVTIFGNLNGSPIPNGSTSPAVINASTGSVIVYGNINAAIGAGLSNTSTGPVTVVGNIIATNTASGIFSSNSPNVRISGNLIGAPNGIPAVYATSYRVDPVPYQTYIRYANNGTGAGADAYLYHYTIDSLSAFSMPPVSSVRAGVQFANNTSTGTCQIPPASSVTFGTLVDNTTGTALLAINDLSQIFNASLSSLTVPNTIGSRIRTATTTEAAGNLIASFTNG